MHRSRSTPWRLIGACLTLWCVSGLPLSAQFDTAVVLGTVRDGSGAVVPGATLTLKSAATGITAETQSDENGNYQFFNVRVGSAYEVTAACQGFGTVIPDPCHECGGDGRVRTRRTLTVKIPPGVDTGTRIQLTGEGEAGPGGGPAGDLFVEVVERPHPLFRRQGDDLHCSVSVPMTAAALGTTVSIETLDGPKPVELRSGTQSGTTTTLTGLGVAHLRSPGRGDLVVHVEVATPTRLDVEQEELMRKLAAIRGEDGPDVGTVTGQRTSFFGRLRDAFNDGQR